MTPSSDSVRAPALSIEDFYFDNPMSGSDESRSAARCHPPSSSPSSPPPRPPLRHQPSETGIDAENAIHPLYVGGLFLFTLITPAISLVFLVTRDVSILVFEKIVLPLTGLVFIMCFFAKPTVETPSYKLFFNLHFVLWAVLPQCFVAVGHLIRRDYVNMSLSFFLLLGVYCPLFHFGAKLRAKIAAQISNPSFDLPRFLSLKVLRNGLSQLGPMLLVALEPIKCLRKNSAFRLFGGGLAPSSEGDLLKYCVRPTVCQTFLGGYVAGYYVLSLCLTLVEVDIKTRDLVALNMSKRQVLVMVLVGINACVSLYLLSFLGGEYRTTRSNEDTLFLGAIGGLAIVAVVIMTIYRVLIPKNPLSMAKALPPVTHVSEFSYLFIIAGFVLSLIHPCLMVMNAVTGDERYIRYGYIEAPVSVFSYFLASFMRPRAADKWYRAFVGLHFFLYAGVSEIAASTGEYIHSKKFPFSLVPVGRLVLFWLPLFLAGSKIRDLIGQLDDDSLDRFLTFQIMGKGSALLGPLLFLSFSTVRCLSDYPGREEVCTRTSLCQVYLGCFMVLLFGMQLVRSAGADDININDLATMRVKTKRRIRAILAMVAGACALFLFSSIGNTSESFESSYDDQRSVAIGLTGVSMAAVGAIWECASILRKSGKPRTKLRDARLACEISDDSIISAFHAEYDDRREVVTEISWVYVLACFGITLFAPIFSIFYSIKLYREFIMFRDLCLPIANLVFMLGCLMKPRRKDLIYMTFVRFHFFAFFVIYEVACGAGYIREGWYWYASFGIARLLCWSLFFWLCLEGRKRVAALPDVELSNFLTKFVIREGFAACIPPMYLGFQGLQCVAGIWGDSSQLTVDTCGRTTSASLYLGACFVTCYAWRMSIRVVSRRTRFNRSLSLVNLAAIKSITPERKVQMCLACIVATGSLYLFFNLQGVGDVNRNNATSTGQVPTDLYLVGSLCFGLLFFNVAIEVKSMLNEDRRMQAAKERTLADEERETSTVDKGSVELRHRSSTDAECNPLNADRDTINPFF